MAGALTVPIVDEGLGNSAYLVDLGDLRALAEGLVVAMCGHGERAATAASVLERAGHTAVAVLSGGPPDWADATGRALESTA